MKSLVLALIDAWGRSALIRRVVLGAAAVLLATASLSACAKSGTAAQEGECLSAGSDLYTVKIVPCSDSTAERRVSKILDGEDRKADCPKDVGIFTSSWSVNGKTICVLKT